MDGYSPKDGNFIGFDVSLVIQQLELSEFSGDSLVSPLVSPSRHGPWRIRWPWGQNISQEMAKFEGPADHPADHRQFVDGR